MYGESDETAYVSYARARLNDHYLHLRFRDGTRGEDFFFLLIQTGIGSAMVLLPVLLVVLFSPVGRWLEQDDSRFRVAVIASWLLVCALMLLWDFLGWHLRRIARLTQIASDTDSEIARDYLQEFGAHSSTTSDHEWQVILRMRELSGWDPPWWGGPRESDHG